MALGSPRALQKRLCRPQQWHAVIITSREPQDAAPSFKLLTMTAAASKDSTGSKDLNVQAFQKSLTAEATKRYGGNVTDNASDAKKESALTFDELAGDEER